MRQISILVSSVLLLTAVCAIGIRDAAIGEGLTGEGEWQSGLGDAMRGTWVATLSRSGTGVEGTISLTGSPLFAGGDVTGTVEGDEVVLGVITEGEHTAMFRGSLTDSKVTGEWDCPTIGDRGVWSGTLQPEERP